MTNKEMVEFLNEEYKETVKLTQFEYDLISALYFNGESYYGFDYTACYFMKTEKIYFNGVKDTSMTLKEILENCEVVE